MLDERIDKLGVYFVHFNIRERYQITFEKFINMVDSGLWYKLVNDVD